MPRKPKGKSKKENDVLSKKERKAVKKLIRKEQEVKFHIPFENAANMDSTPIIIGCTDISAGTTDNTRIGDKLRLTEKMFFKYTMNVDVGNDAAQQVILCRLVLFQWHPTTQSGGATEPAASDVFINGPSGAVDSQSFYNHDKKQDYTILYDKCITMVGPGTSTSNAYNPSMIKNGFKIVSLKKARKNLQFVATSGVTATNHIYLMYLANVANDLQNPLLTWSAQIFYTDS